ncbi:hypothetical protein GCM10020001_056890 [Nonomuraea salmonea]
MGVEVVVDGLTKSFGRQVIWEDVSLTLPAGEISVLLGPSGTGKSVFLKTLVGLLRPDRGHIWIDGHDLATYKENTLYELRRLFGVLFQDGALFGSLNLYDNIAFPLREHTRKSETQIRQIVMEKIDLVGLLGAESKLPGRSPAACASGRAWPGRWCWSRRSSCSTSRTRGSTPSVRRSSTSSSWTSMPTSRRRS